MENINDLVKIPEGAFLVTAYVFGPYPSIQNRTGLETLKRRLDKSVKKEIPTKRLVDKAYFVLHNNNFEFNGQTSFETFQYSQVQLLVINLPFLTLLMDDLEEEFLEGEPIKPLIFLRYSDNVFFISTRNEEELLSFIARLTTFAIILGLPTIYPDRWFPFWITYG